MNIDELEPGLELDVLVIEAVMEPRPLEGPAEPWIKKGEYSYRARSPLDWWLWVDDAWVPGARPSVHWSAAGDLLEKMQTNGWMVSLLANPGPGWVCCFRRGNVIGWDHAETAYLAICRAVLAAVRYNGTESEEEADADYADL